MHKSQLLENEVELILTKEKFYAQRLVLTNSQKRKKETQIVKRSENENIELIHNLQLAVKKYINEDHIESYIRKKFGKTIKKVEYDLSKRGGWFKLIFKILGAIDNEKDFFKLLSDYDLIPKEIETKEQFDKHIEISFHSEMKHFLKKQNLSDLAISIDLISTYYNHKIKNNLVAATKHYTDVLYDTENYQNRLNLFDHLYEIEVIKGGKLKSYYECVDCPPNTFNGVLTTNLKPSRIKLKCPSCNKELLYIVPYELEKAIYDDIVEKDGLLFYAIQYLLEKNNYSFQSNQTLLKDIELDFCLINNENQIYEIIEVKMFKTDRPSDTQISNIKQAVSQMKDAINKLIEIDLGYKTIHHSIVTNITNQSVYKDAKIVLDNDLREYNISLYTIPEFYNKVNLKTD